MHELGGESNERARLDDKRLIRLVLLQELRLPERIAARIDVGRKTRRPHVEPERSVRLQAARQRLKRSPPGCKSWRRCTAPTPSAFRAHDVLPTGCCCACAKVIGTPVSIHTCSSSRRHAAPVHSSECAPPRGPRCGGIYPNWRLCTRRHNRINVARPLFRAPRCSPAPLAAAHHDGE